ncbi:hypothetical protein Tcan_11267 [Toxocara canis]|uniref:Uncharacterized protein n=1 Tax=Toxocara canis TaxID=6265 RepID=A0A0B2V5B5_TOXCA|nr:hypothetical protein Tcan_11267 [Toxocara canis]
MSTNKRTIVDKTIVRRTPSGRLLSKSTTRTVYYDDVGWKQYTDDTHRLEAQYIHSGCKQKFHEKSVRSTTIPHNLADAHRYPSTQHQTQSYSTAMLANTDDRSLRTEYAEPVLFGDETVYGDDWSNSGSLQGRLTIARTSSIGDMNGSRNDSITILSQIVSEINRRRKICFTNINLANHILQNQFESKSNI